jgi:very-short-patch-repair endonuclease
MGEGLIVEGINYMSSDRRRTQWRASEIVKEVAKQNRKGSTEAEKALWSMLRDDRCDGFKFRRQTPIGPFVADFCCPSVKLIVEADGGIHTDEAQARRDVERDEILREAYGYRILRLPNELILNHPSEAISRIKTVLKDMSDANGSD